MRTSQGGAARGSGRSRPRRRRCWSCGTAGVPRRDAVRDGGHLDVLEAAVLPAGRRHRVLGGQRPRRQERAGPAEDRPAGWTGCGCASWPNGGCCGRRSRRRRGSGSCGTCAGTGAPWPRSGPGRSSARRSCWRTQIKLSSVISDIFGVSGRAMLEALIAGQHNPRILAELAQGQPPHAPHLTRNSGSLRGKIPTREGLPTPCSPPTAQPFL
jgi:hypothetical protein